MSTREISVSSSCLPKTDEEGLVPLLGSEQGQRTFFKASWKEVLPNDDSPATEALQEFLRNVEDQLQKHMPSSVLEVKPDTLVMAFDSCTAESLSLQTARSRVAKRITCDPRYQAKKEVCQRILREMVQEENDRTKNPRFRIEFVCRARPNPRSSISLLSTSIMGYQQAGVNIVIWLWYVELRIFDNDQEPFCVCVQSAVTLRDNSQLQVAQGTEQGDSLSTHEEDDRSIQKTELAETTDEEVETARSMSRAERSTQSKATFGNNNLVTSDSKMPSSEETAPALKRESTRPSQPTGTRRSRRIAIGRRKFHRDTSHSDGTTISYAQTRVGISGATAGYSDGANLQLKPKRDSSSNKRKRQQASSPGGRESGKPFQTSERSVFHAGLHVPTDADISKHVTHNKGLGNSAHERPLNTVRHSTRHGCQNESGFTRSSHRAGSDIEQTRPCADQLYYEHYNQMLTTLGCSITESARLASLLSFEPSKSERVKFNSTPHVEEISQATYLEALEARYDLAASDLSQRPTIKGSRDRSIDFDR